MIIPSRGRGWEAVVWEDVVGVVHDAAGVALRSALVSMQDPLAKECSMC